MGKEMVYVCGLEDGDTTIENPMDITECEDWIPRRSEGKPATMHTCHNCRWRNREYRGDQPSSPRTTAE